MQQRIWMFHLLVVYCIGFIQKSSSCLQCPAYSHLSPVGLSGDRLFLHWKELNATSSKEVSGVHKEERVSRKSAGTVQAEGIRGWASCRDQSLCQIQSNRASHIFPGTWKAFWEVGQLQRLQFRNSISPGKVLQVLLHCLYCIWVTIATSHQGVKWVFQIQAGIWGTYLHEGRGWVGTSCC